MQNIGIAFGITVLVAYLFYRSVYAMGLLVVIIPVVCRQRQREAVQRQKRELCLEFKDAMQALSASMQAGYSVENAWREAQLEIEQLHGMESMMSRELVEMNRQVGLNVPIEQLLWEFAQRSGCEDIISFSQVFQFAKRSGGNFIKIIQKTTERIEAKMEVEQEIVMVLAAKKMEQKIMELVPVFILFYMNLSSPDLMSALYGNLPGILFMTGCLLLYLLAICWAKRIVQIEV